VIKQILVGASLTTVGVAGFGATAFANPPQTPPGCVKNGHPYGPPCGPPTNKGGSDNGNGNGGQNNGNGNGNGHSQSVNGKNSAFVTHRSTGTSSSGEFGIFVSIAGVSLAGLLALRKRPATR